MTDEQEPTLTMDLPARHFDTPLHWQDLVLGKTLLSQLAEIRQWLRHSESLASSGRTSRPGNPGFHALFYGPPGTGKATVASLLAKDVGRDLYRVDLSMAASKYIGETEKNLAALFDTAQDGNWVLLFDEADALFGKRTGVKDAHDRYANQEVSYLLQRLEGYRGLAILTSNRRDAIDEAFLRRLHSVVKFPLPTAAQRRKIWHAALGTSPAPPDPRAFSSGMARFELSGGSIVRAAQFAALTATDDKRGELRYADAALGVQREFEKEGREFENLVADEQAREA